MAKDRLTQPKLPGLETVPTTTYVSSFAIGGYDDLSSLTENQCVLGIVVPPG